MQWQIVEEATIEGENTFYVVYDGDGYGNARPQFDPGRSAIQCESRELARFLIELLDSQHARMTRI